MQVCVNRRISSILCQSFCALLLVAPLALAQRPPERLPEPVKASPNGPGTNTEFVNSRPVAAREVLFQFRDTFLTSANAEQITSTITELRRTEDAEEFEMLSDSGILRIRSRTYTADSLIKRLSQRPDIFFAEPNYIFHLAAAAVNDHRFGDLWGLHNNGQGVIPGVPGADIDAVKAWTMTTGSVSNVVAVIDTGVDYNHPDLAANMWRAPAAFSISIGGRTITCAAGTRGFNALTGSCDPMDDQGHGTHVAGTIGAVGNNGIGVVGVNRTARIMALKFLDSNGYGSSADAIKCIDFAIKVKNKFAATKAANVRVLNNSWGGDGFSQSLLDAIRRSHQAEMLFVAAAGNDWRDIDFTPTYPASYKEPNVITVAATNNQDQRAYFSNYGVKSVHIAAPGETILSTTPHGEYAFLSGTSMATPHVTGVAALVLSNCTVNTVDLKDVLIRSGDKLTALNGVTITGARLNAANAITACTQPYYTLSANPTELTVRPGMTGVWNITITPFKGYSGPVTMNVTGLPPGVTAAFEPAVVSMAGVSKTTTLTMNLPLDVVPGIHTLTINGVSPTQDRTVTAFLRAPGYAITNLGSLPAPVADRKVEAFAVNNTGEVAGWSNAQAPGSFSVFSHGFVYSSGTMRDVGTMGGGPISVATSIGNQGHVAGYSMNAAGYTRAFLWSNGSMTGLGVLPGYLDSYAFDVNDSGHVVGYSGQMFISERAFLKTTGPMQNLGTLGGSMSRALALNNVGQVVGYSEKSISVYHAFLYSNGTMKDLGTIGGNPNGGSKAHDINDKGQIAGESTVGDDLFTVHAALWQGGKVTDLGGLVGLPYSYGKSINEAGHVVGFVAAVDETIAGDSRRAFLYRDGRMLNLNDAIPLNTPWVLLQANSINDNGVIVGVGTLNGEPRAFMLTPLR